MGRAERRRTARLTRWWGSQRCPLPAHLTPSAVRIDAHIGGMKHALSPDAVKFDV
jgi:hypothetical protein